MTGSIIPAEQWPEGAHLHTWDSNGLGNWHRPTYGAWFLWASDIPLPHGHDWRVPVMRPAAEDSSTVAPVIDLEQFREAVTYFRDAYAASSLGPDSWQSAKVVEADRLLALIDGNKNSNLPHVDDINVVVSQPTKGEGVTHD